MAAVLPAVLLAACSSGASDQKSGPTSVPTSQGGDAVPVISDLAPGYDLEGNKVLDIRGISLGMPRSDAKVALVSLYPGKPPEEFGWTFTGSEGPISVSHDYIQYDQVSPDRGAKNYEGMKVEYSNGLTGGRVVKITRQLQYGTNQPSLDETLKSVFDKYGQPTLTTNLGTVTDYMLVWFDGKLVPPVTQKDVEAFSQTASWQDPPKNPVWCLDNRVGRDAFQIVYNYQPGGGRDKAVGCTAYLSVEVRVGDRPDLLGGMDMTLVDHQRVVDGNAVTDKWLAEEIKKEAATKGGGATPTM